MELPNDNTVAELADALASPTLERYTLRLYVTGTTSKSIRAIANLRRICEDYLQDRYDLEVIDLYQQPYLAGRDQIIAVPTLVKVKPDPLKKIIGDMSNTRMVLVGLDLNPKREP